MLYLTWIDTSQVVTMDTERPSPTATTITSQEQQATSNRTLTQ